MNRGISGQLDDTGFGIVDAMLPNIGKDSWFRVKAMIDTGASRCLIQESLTITTEKVFFQESVAINPVGGIVPTKEYLIDLMLDEKNERGGIVIPNVRFCAINEPSLQVGLLIGAEFLKNFDFVYNGTKNSFSLYL